MTTYSPLRNWLSGSAASCVLMSVVGLTLLFGLAAGFSALLQASSRIDFAALSSVLIPALSSMMEGVYSSLLFVLTAGMWTVTGMLLWFYALTIAVLSLACLSYKVRQQENLVGARKLQQIDEALFNCTRMQFIVGLLILLARYMFNSAPSLVFEGSEGSVFQWIERTLLGLSHFLFAPCMWAVSRFQDKIRN